MNKIITILFLVFIHNLSSQVNQSDITLVTVSSGKSPSEAIKLALRDALEQSFGTFISSNTQILNDELIKDEIVSLSSGNIVDYEVLSQSELSNGYYSVSVRSTVSLTSFASYMQNKGHEVSFSGKSFGMKIKLQKLNEQSEEKAIDNMILVLRDIIMKSVDFEISDISEPVFKEDWSEAEGKELYNVIINVKPIINENYDSFKKFFLETLRSIAMSDSEVEEYSRLKMKVYTFIAFDEEHFNYPNELKKFEFIDKEKFDRDMNWIFSKLNTDSFTSDTDNSLLTDAVKIEIHNFKNVALHNLNVMSKGASKSQEMRYFITPKPEIITLSNHSKLYVEKINLGSKRGDYNSIRGRMFKIEYPVGNFYDTSNRSWKISGHSDWYEKTYTNGIFFRPNSDICNQCDCCYEHINILRDGNRIGYLRGHDDLKFRSKESLKKIDLFLQKNQLYFFNFSLNYGEDTWSPLYKITKPYHIAFYQKPVAGLPSAYNNWNPFGYYSRYISSYTNVIDKSRYMKKNFRGDYLYKVTNNSTFFNYLKNPNDLVLDSKPFGQVSPNEPQLFFTEMLPFEKTYWRSSSSSLDINHTISLKFTLSELENIDGFKIMNRNIID